MIKKLMALTLTLFMTSTTLGLMPVSASESTEKTKNEAITVFLAGDSTVSNYEAKAAPRAGWGQVIDKYFTKDVTVKNYAKSGRSTKSYINEGYLDKILNEIKPNDYLLIQFGHNDEKIDQASLGTDPDTTYKDYLKKYIDGARQHNATPILITPVGRRKFDKSGNIVPTHGKYPEAMKQLAKEENVQLVDLTTLSENYFQTLGADKTKDIFLYENPGENVNYPEGVGDDTHFQENGANEMAKLVVNELKKLNIPLKDHIKDTSKVKYASVIDANYTGKDGEEINGSKTYKTVQAAINAVDSNNTKEYIIFIKSGVYYGKVNIDKPYITLIGENAKNTRITYDLAQGSLNAEGKEWGNKCATVNITAAATDFSAANITFENCFDEQNPDVKSKQALAVRDDGDRSVFSRCRFLGNQDTLFANIGRQYYYKCYIEGDVDFIYGGAAAVLENCDIMSLDRGSDKNNGYICAPSTVQDQNCGFLIENSRLVSNISAPGTVSLGRPWHPSSSKVPVNSCVIYKNCTMDNHISAKGWEDMSGNSFMDNRMYEYGSLGQGAIKSDTRRVLSEEEALQYTPEKVFGDWDAVNYVSDSKLLN